MLLLPRIIAESVTEKTSPDRLKLWRTKSQNPHRHRPGEWPHGRSIAQKPFFLLLFLPFFSGCFLTRGKLNFLPPPICVSNRRNRPNSSTHMVQENHPHFGYTKIHIRAYRALLAPWTGGLFFIMRIDNSHIIHIHTYTFNPSRYLGGGRGQSLRRMSMTAASTQKVERARVVLCYNFVDGY